MRSFYRRLLQLLGGAKQEETLFPWQEEDDRFRQMTFTFAVIALAAKLSSVDGAARKEEFTSFCELFPLLHEERGKLHRLFMMACQDQAGTAHYARQIRMLFPDRDDLLRDLLGRFKSIARADGPITAEETQWLEDIAELWDIVKPVRGPKLISERQETDPYALLGVSSSASPEEIRLAYHKRIRELHPDTLSAQGHAPEAIQGAQAALADVNDAYGTLRKKRKRK